MTRKSYSFVEPSTGSPQRVFDVLADIPNWSKWGGPLIMRSWVERPGDPPPGGVGAIRALGTKHVGSREEIAAYDPPRHLAYTILSGAPVRNYRADVTIAPDGTGSRITWEGSYQPAAGPAAPIVHFVMTRTVHRLVRGLARYAGEESAGCSRVPS